MYHVREFQAKDSESVLLLLNLKDIINSASFSEKVCYVVFALVILQMLFS